MKNNVKRIAVIGQGIIGLSSAKQLLDSGFAVDVISKDDWPQSASMAAGAYWWPHRAYPQERISHWAKETFLIYKQEKDIPASGVSFRQHLRFCVDPDESAYVRHILDEWQDVHGLDYGFDCAETFLVSLPVIEVPIYMPYLREQVRSAGARFLTREIQDFKALSHDYSLVVNCSGLGARELAQDEAVFPIRGQVVRVSSVPGLRRSTRVYRRKDELTLVLPRSNDIVLGGTSQENDWSLNAREEDTQDILNRCHKIVPTLEKCDLLAVQVGLRPGRDAVRLELEQISLENAVIHNYGHGGSGYTVAWGCANEVRELAHDYLS